MKKIALLLAIVFVLSVFITSCNNDSEVSDGSESSSAETSSEAENKQNLFTEISVVDEPKEAVVSNGAVYTHTVPADEKYPDSFNSELTDGVRCESASFDDAALSGYPRSSGNTRVSIDLGFECENIYKFTVGYLATTSSGINAPSSIRVQGSFDNKRWETIGVATIPEFVEGTMQEAVLVTDKYIKARYFRFIIQAGAAWVFLDEIQIIADQDPSDQSAEYVEAVNGAYKELGAIKRPDNGKDINRDLNKVLVSKGKNYVVEANQNPNFADDGTKLTDGLTTGFYQGGTWVGYEGGEDITVKIDLGATVDDIASVEASFYTNTTVKIFLPVAVKVAAISENNERTELGILYGNTFLTNGNYWYTLPLEKTVSARYIEFTMVATDSRLYMVEELAVYAYRTEYSGTLYPPLEFDTDSTDWGSGASSEYTNLISGKTPQILSISDPKIDNYKNNTPVTSGLLTDGKRSASVDIHNGSFFKFNQGAGRVVIFDLEHISAIDKVTARFIQNTGWGIQAPATVQVGVSYNGTDWYEVAVLEKPNVSGDKVLDYSAQLNGKVKARYVLFNFPVGTWAGCDEIEVFGTKSTAGAKEPNSYPKKTLLAGQRIEPSDNILGGSEDLCLMYIGDNRGYTVEDMMPYVAYLDENGEIKDTMFDSFLFLYMGQFPSGGYPYSDGKLSDWDWSADDVFQDGKNLKALEEAAGIVKEKLGLDANYKYKVTLTLYYPLAGLANVGDIDGDGKTDSFDNVNNRIAAIKNYIDKLDARFNAQNFKNIELVGYYWFHETIESKDSDSMTLLNNVSDYVHTKGKDFFWIPYFSSNGFNAWAEYGFDYAVMQPNYVFELETPYSNVINCAKLTQLYGMGVEMEICGDSLTDINFFKKYMQYVAGGVDYGYMTDCIVMYYQEVYAFRNACNSDTVMGRMVYDATYHFIKEDLKYQPDSLENISATVEKDTPYTGTLGLSTEKLHEFSVYLAPDHGSVTLNSDGTFVFYPETGYTGDVKFSLVYSEYLGWSEPCEVTITVK